MRTYLSNWIRFPVITEYRAYSYCRRAPNQQRLLSMHGAESHDLLITAELPLQSQSRQSLSPSPKTARNATVRFILPNTSKKRRRGGANETSRRPRRDEEAQVDPAICRCPGAPSITAQGRCPSGPSSSLCGPSSCAWNAWRAWSALHLSLFYVFSPSCASFPSCASLRWSRSMTTSPTTENVSVYCVPGGIGVKSGIMLAAIYPSSAGLLLRAPCCCGDGAHQGMGGGGLLFCRCERACTADAAGWPKLESAGMA